MEVAWNIARETEVGGRGLVLVRAKEGRKRFCALSRPTLRSAHQRTRRCGWLWDCTLPHSLENNICWLDFSVQCCAKHLLTLKNNGWSTIFVQVRPGFAQYSEVLDSPWKRITIWLWTHYICCWARTNIQVHLSAEGDGNTLEGLSSLLKVLWPSSVALRRSTLGQLKTVMCCSDVKWERGQVNHRVKEIKDDGRTAVWKRWVVARERLDPTAKFLFLADKGVLIYALIFPPHFFLLCISFFGLSSTSLFLSLPVPCNNGESVGSSASPRCHARVSDSYYTSTRICFVCVAFAPVAHLSHFWRNMVAARSMASWSKMRLHVVLRIHSRDIRAEAAGKFL